MSKRVSAYPAPSLPARMDSDRGTTNADDDGEPCYSNFGSGADGANLPNRPRIPSDTTKASRKPMPAPKPGVLKQDKSKVQDSQRKSAVVLRKSVSLDDNPYDEAMLVNSNKMVKNPPQISEPEPVYAEALAVAHHLLPSDERKSRVPDVIPEAIYDEASVVCVNKLPKKEKPVSKLIQPTKQQEENVYEDAAVVSLKKLPSTEIDLYEDVANVSVEKLPSNEVNGKVAKKEQMPVEAIYSEANVVNPSKLPSDEKKASKKAPAVATAAVECVYEEAAAFKKSGNDSSDDEQPLQFSLLVLRMRNQSIWKSKADPQSVWTKLEQNTSRLSRVKVLPDLPPMKKFGHNLGGFPEEGESGSGLSKSNSLEEEWSTDLMGLHSCDETEMNKMRKWVVGNILESEKSYCEILELLVTYMNNLKEFAGTKGEYISMKDIETIFFGIQDLRTIHAEFIQSLQPIVDKWSKERPIGPVIKEMTFREYGVANEYVKKHQEAVCTIHRCRNESQKFSDLIKVIKCGQLETSLEELLRKPIERFQRNILVLHDLKNYTPTSHPDFILIVRSLQIAKNFLEECTGFGENNADDSRQLVKHGIVVEKPDKDRKLRQLFLFNDIIICCKQKLSARHRLTYDVKWFIPLCDVKLEDKFSAQEEKQAAVLYQQEIKDLKEKVISLQGDLKKELKKQKTEGQAVVGQRQNKTVENICKKLSEQEAELLLASPHLQLKLTNRVNKKTFVLLMASDYERNNWKSAISGLTGKATQIPAKLSLTDVVNIINSQKIPKLLGPALDGSEISLEDERLNGSLNVTIHKLQGLKSEADAFCCMEVDSFGHFFMKAKTNRAKAMEPTWNEDFDIDLEGAQRLHILCYKLGQQTDSLLGKCSLLLQKEWITEDFRDKPVTLGNELLLTVSLKYTSPENLMRSSLHAKSGVFGVRLDRTVKKEGKLVPIIVTSCIEEIEKRGLKDVGIYRVSGLSSEIQRLKKSFDKNSCNAANQLDSVDSNVITSLIKLFFRELPEALFTDNGYPEFVKGFALSDPEAKQKFLIGQLSSLPPCNYATILYLMDHLVRVSKHEEENKMSLPNLAIVFGFTLLRPAEKDQKTSRTEWLFSQGTEDAARQTAILLYFLNLKAKNFDFPVPKSGK